MNKKRTENKESCISFNPLLKLLIDNGMKTSELSKEAGISASTMTAIRAHQSVTLDTLVKICRTLECSIEDVVEIIRDEVIDVEVEVEDVEVEDVEVEDVEDVEVEDVEVGDVEVGGEEA